MMQRYVKALRIPAKIHLVFFFWHLNEQSSPGSLHLHANAVDEVYIIFPTKKKKTITNLNILLYQTNLDYRCNHQSSKTRTKKIHVIQVKYTTTIQKTSLPINTLQEKNKACRGMFYCSSCSSWIKWPLLANE